MALQQPRAPASNILSEISVGSDASAAASRQRHRAMRTNMAPATRLATEIIAGGYFYSMADSPDTSSCRVFKRPKSCTGVTRLKRPVTRRGPCCSATIKARHARHSKRCSKHIHPQQKVARRFRTGADGQSDQSWSEPPPRKCAAEPRGDLIGTLKPRQTSLHDSRRPSGELILAGASESSTRRNRLSME
jgi:hypothetical protein